MLDGREIVALDLVLLDLLEDEREPFNETGEARVEGEIDRCELVLRVHQQTIRGEGGIRIK